MSASKRTAARLVCAVLFAAGLLVLIFAAAYADRGPASAGEASLRSRQVP